VSCWPVAAGVVGVVREAARLENSAVVFACWSLMFSATGPNEILLALIFEIFAEAGWHTVGDALGYWVVLDCVRGCGSI